MYVVSASENGSGYELLQESAWCKNGGSVMISETLSLKNCSYECGETHGATMFRHGRAGTATCSGEDQCYCSCVINANLDTCLVDIDTSYGFNLYKINPSASNFIVSTHTYLLHLHLCISDPNLIVLG